MSSCPKPTIDGPLFQMTRTADPETSREAAERVAGSVSDHEEIIVDTLRQIGPATSPVIACGCLLTPQQVHKRMAGLRRKGLIEAGEKVACRTDGANRIEWRLK